MGVFLFLIGSLAVGVGFWWLIINLFRKRPKKRPALIFAAGFIIMTVGVIATPTDPLQEAAPKEVTETPKAEEKAEAPEKVEKTQTEKDAEAAEQKKAEDDKAAAEKADVEQKLADEKEFYVNEVKTKVDTQMGMYDEAWSTFWVPTFEGISNGTVDVYQAYDNMKSLQQRYETLRSSLPAIEVASLSEDNKEQFDIFIDKMRSASWWRMEGAKKSQDMFDQGDFSPSKMDAITTDIEIGDSEMMEAVVALTKIEMNLGIERE